MPIFDYTCTDCHSVYDIYHRGKEDSQKVVCPTCGSSNARKLVSIPAAVGVGNSDSGPGHCQSDPSHGGISGGCCGGMCHN